MEQSSGGNLHAGAYSFSRIADISRPKGGLESTTDVLKTVSRGREISNINDFQSGQPQVDGLNKHQAQVLDESSDDAAVLTDGGNLTRMSDKIKPMSTSRR